MKIKEQTSKLAAGCSKHCFEVVDKTDEVSHIYTVATLTWFEFDFRRVETHLITTILPQSPNKNWTSSPNAPIPLPTALFE